MEVSKHCTNSAASFVSKLPFSLMHPWSLVAEGEIFNFRFVEATSRVTEGKFPSLVAGCCEALCRSRSALFNYRHQISIADVLLSFDEWFLSLQLVRSLRFVEFCNSGTLYVFGSREFQAFRAAVRYRGSKLHCKF